MSFKDSVMQVAHSAGSVTTELMQNPKVAHGSAWATIATGIATAFEKIDVSVGAVASVMGILLTSTMIIVNIRKDRREASIHNLEKIRLEQIIKKNNLESKDD